MKRFFISLGLLVFALIGLITANNLFSVITGALAVMLGLLALILSIFLWVTK